MKDYKVPEAACPSCGLPNNGALAMTDNDEKPEPGDIGICIGCREIHIYNKDFSMRKPTEDDILGMDLALIYKAQKLIGDTKNDY